MSVAGMAVDERMRAVQLHNKVVVITGGANGIGHALAQRFKHEGARAIAVADLDGAKAAAVAQEIGGLGFHCDVSQEQDIQRVVRETEAVHGPIDLFCSNAGIAIADPDFDNAASAPNAVFERNWGIHVMAHVYAARALLPRMIARGSGYFLNTVSAAGLLSQIGSATYSATKHAAIGFAESLAITHRDHGIKVSVLCPQAVRTAMLGNEPEKSSASVDGIISAETVATAVIAGLAAETFLILPHPIVAEYIQHKSANYDRWLGGMAKLRRKIKQ
jgi:NAD(P)-dependent dehydrogenase (short-subunit alcohol dehydrogenase family)